MEHLVISGIPHIDYFCRYELLNEDELETLITTFKKAMLWHQSKQHEIDDFDDLYRSYIDEIKGQFKQVGSIN